MTTVYKKVIEEPHWTQDEGVKNRWRFIEKYVIGTNVSSVVYEGTLVMLWLSQKDGVSYWVFAIMDGSGYQELPNNLTLEEAQAAVTALWRMK